jgi:hypothetical protein
MLVVPFQDSMLLKMLCENTRSFKVANQRAPLVTHKFILGPVGDESVGHLCVSLDLQWLAASSARPSGQPVFLPDLGPVTAALHSLSLHLYGSFFSPMSEHTLGISSFGFHAS